MRKTNRPAYSATTRSLVLLAGLCLAGAAGAHTANMSGHGFVAGFSHPIFGLDHMLAMLAVGMWGAFLGAPAIWALPVTFPLVMAFGAMLGIAGVPLPGAEWVIAFSMVALGAAIALAARPPILVAAALVGLFAIFHGFAHGQEMPAEASALPFAIGFVLATGLIHILGIAIGLVVRLPNGTGILRFGGLLIAAVGCWFGLQLVA